MTERGSLSRNQFDLLQAEKDYSETPPIPPELSLEMTTACNQACLFCPNRKQSKHVPTMSLPDAQRWLTEAAALGVRRVGLHAKGEPFLVRGLDSYVRTAREAGFTDIFLTTNGSGATPDRLRKAVAAGLSSVKFSINGYGRENYYLVHGEDHWQKVTTNLEVAIGLRKTHGLAVFISSVQTNLSDDAGKRLRADYEHRVDEVVVYGCSNFCGYLDTGALGAVPPKRHRPCNLPFAKLHITPEGYLSACCGDYENYLAVADLKQTSIAEAWFSEPFRALRRRHLADDLHGLVCDACMNGRHAASAQPLVSPLANRIEDGYWRHDDIEPLIDQRNKKWEGKTK